ncbi:MAG: DUF2971 domain-containing protein, partial [Halomonas sp.]
DEGGSADILDWRKYFFVSCWSSSEEESIPLWSMYTNDMKGVRLKVKTDMFKKYRYSLDSVPSFMHLADTSSAPPGARVMLESYMPYDEMHGESYMVMPPSWRKEDWPYAIEYTNEESKLKQEILKQNSVTGQTTISYNEVARYKRKVWRFQDEWRFRLYCHNAAPRSLMGKMSETDYYNLMIKSLSMLGTGISQEHLYLTLDENVFENIEILMGPKVVEAERIMVNALKQKYCPSASLLNSQLSGKIR